MLVEFILLQEIVLVHILHLHFVVIVASTCSCQTDSFSVVYQSKDTVLASGQCCPLVCVASGHKLSYIYEWNKVNDGSVGADSPVLWVNTSGIYRCKVSDAGTHCYSNNVRVTMIDDGSDEGTTFQLQFGLNLPFY